MKKTIAIVLTLILALGLLTACGSTATASGTVSTATSASASENGAGTGFPEKTTITMIVPGKAGGGSDLAIRYISESMSKNLGLTTTVTNYDSNTIGHQTCANSANDGTYLTLATAALNIQYITGATDLDPFSNFTLIACLQDNGYSALAVPADAPYDTFAEFVAYAKENPGKINAGQPANGNNTFQFGMIMNECEIELNPVECASESDRLTNLAGGFIDIGFVGVGNAVEYEKAGKLKVIGTVAADGLLIENFDSTLPENYKTLQEQGFEDCYWGVHHFLLGPAGMDEEQVKAMNASIKAVVEDEKCREGIASLGQVPEWYNLEDSKAIMKAEYDRIVEVAKLLGKYVQG